MLNKEQLIELFHKYSSGYLTASEEAAFIKSLRENRGNPQFDEILWELYQQSDETQYWQREFRESFADRLMKRLPATRQVYYLRKSFLRYAAAALLVLAAGAYLWTTNKKNEQALDVDNVSVRAKIVPGKDGAILTLADGRQLVLDTLSNGVVASEHGSQVILYNGQLTYNVRQSKTEKQSYNTMTTPKGRQFQLVLPDGSRVWLNAASSIKYPTVFKGVERLVEIEGEVYFEILPNPKMPFRIKTAKGPEVEVLGTSFNINAYANEDAVATTLVEGAVRIKANNETVVLQPRQYAVANSTIRVDMADEAKIRQVTAWKSGYFDFNNTDLRTMMRQVERWYDIEAVYEGKPPGVIFQGKMDRNVQLKDVVRFLKIFGIKTELYGRTLIISGN